MGVPQDRGAGEWEGGVVEGVVSTVGVLPSFSIPLFIASTLPWTFRSPFLVHPPSHPTPPPRCFLTSTSAYHLISSISTKQVGVEVRCEAAEGRPWLAVVGPGDGEEGFKWGGDTQRRGRLYTVAVRLKLL